MSAPSPDVLVGAVVRIEWAAETRWSKYFEFVVAWATLTTIGLRPVSGDGVASGLVVAPWTSIATLSPVR